MSKLETNFEGGSPAKRARKTNFEKNFNFWRDLDCSENKNIHAKSKSKFVLPVNQPQPPASEGLDIYLEDTQDQAKEIY